VSPASPPVAVGIDAGSRTTRCVMAALEESRLRLIGWGQVASEGWLRGAIDDPGRVSKSIREAVEQAERMSGLAVESAVVGIGGLAIYSGNARGVCELGHHREINRSDLRRSIERAARLQFAEDSMLYHVAPQNFIVDESPPRRNPVGLAGSRLEAYVHVVLGRSRSTRRWWAR
jgi:cell division protein FtsA